MAQFCNGSSLVVIAFTWSPYFVSFFKSFSFFKSWYNDRTLVVPTSPLVFRSDLFVDELSLHFLIPLKDENKEIFFFLFNAETGRDQGFVEQQCFQQHKIFAIYPDAQPYWGYWDVTDTMSKQYPWKQHEFTKKGSVCLLVLQKGPGRHFYLQYQTHMYC